MCRDGFRDTCDDCGRTVTCRDDSPTCEDCMGIGVWYETPGDAVYPEPPSKVISVGVVNR